MNIRQKIVAMGAASGVISMALVMIIGSLLVPSPQHVAVIADRIAFALQLNVFAMLPLFVMFIVVGNSRFLSDAIDPTKHAEKPYQEVDGRVVDNTLQQNFIFLIATLALSTVIPRQWLQVLIMATIVFFLARIAFWYGYRVHPLYRAPGMAATGYLNLALIAMSVYFIVFGSS